VQLLHNNLHAVCAQSRTNFFFAQKGASRISQIKAVGTFLIFQQFLTIFETNLKTATLNS
jgi:hypothetical protein